MKNILIDLVFRKALGVDLFINNGIIEAASVTTLKRKKGGVSVVSQTLFLNEQDMWEFLQKQKAPVYLSISGKDLLHSINKINNNEKLLSFNYKDEEFYKRQFNNANILFEIFSRREAVELFIEFFEKHKIDLLYITLGPESLYQNGIIKEISKNELKAGFYFINSELGLLKPVNIIENSGEHETIFNIAIENIHLVSFANALSAYAKTENNINQVPDKIKINSASYYYKQIIHKTGICYLLICLVVLLINFLIFNKLTNTYQLASIDHSGFLIKETLLDSLKNIKIQQDHIMGHGNSNYSQICYELTTDMPSDIYLEELSIVTSPIQDTSTKEEIVKIYGTVQDPTSLHSWVNYLEYLSFVNSIKIERFKLLEQSNRNQFQLLILLK
jgi:hypothetical protein